MKRKHQKGSGLFNFFRRTRRQPPAADTVQAFPLPAIVPQAANTRSGFRKFFNRFTRKQPARVIPVQEPLSRPPSIARPGAPSFSRAQTPSETVFQAINRILVFFFKKHFPAEANRYPPNARQLSAEDHLRLVRAFREFYSSLPEGSNMDNKLNRIATEFFNSPSLSEFDQELRIEEIGEENHRKILNEGTPNARISFTGCGSLSRCINHLLSFPREIQYIGNVNAYYSPILANNKPLLSLQSEKPIDVFKSVQKVERILRNSAFSINNYIVIKPQFYRNPGRTPIKANRFAQTSFIQDAFEQEGVLAIDPQLFALLQEDAPELLQKGEIKLATPDQLEDLDIVSGKFMIFEEGALRYRRTYLYPPAIPAIREAMENRQVLLTDPLTMYILRKDDPELWRTCFNDVNMDTYKKLTPVEQLVFGLLQYIQIYKRYKQNVARMPPQDALRVAIHLFSIPINTPDLLPQYMEKFQNANSAEWRALEELKTKITNQSVNINDIEDIQSMFAKMIEDEIRFEALPSVSPAELDIEGLQNQIERLNRTIQILNTQRREAPPNSRERRIASELIRQSMNTRRALQKTIQLRQNEMGAFGRSNIRSTRRRFRS